MTKAFIYVFKKEDRDNLLSLGYEMLKADESASVFVFLNDSKQTFSKDDMEFALSDVLTF